MHIICTLSQGSYIFRTVPDLLSRRGCTLSTRARTCFSQTFVSIDFVTTNLASFTNLNLKYYTTCEANQILPTSSSRRAEKWIFHFDVICGECLQSTLWACTHCFRGRHPHYRVLAHDVRLPQQPHLPLWSETFNSYKQSWPSQQRLVSSTIYPKQDL